MSVLKFLWTTHYEGLDNFLDQFSTILNDEEISHFKCEQIRCYQQLQEHTEKTAILLHISAMFRLAQDFSGIEKFQVAVQQYICICSVVNG